MGRFSPTVEPVPDLGLANALGAFTESYMQAQNRKDRRAQQDRQNDVEMLHSGYQPDELASAPPPPAGPLARLRAAVTGRTDPDQIATAVQNAAPGVQGANDVNARLAQALSSGESGGFVQEQPTAAAITPPTSARFNSKGLHRSGGSRSEVAPTDRLTRREQLPEERRRRATLADALGQAQINNYKSEAERRYQIEHPKPVAPVPGSPEWLALKVQEAKIANEYGYHAPPTQFSFGTTIDANGNPVVLRQNTKTGEVTPTDAVKPATGQGGGRGSATIQKAVAENKTNMTVIDDALKELDAHPDAVGLQRGIADLPLIGGFGDAVNQRRDPAGVAARASLSNVASLVIKDRSGSAVSVSESARLRPFIPSVGDTPEAIRTKLRKLKGAIQVETDLLERNGGGSGSSQHTAPTGDHSEQPKADAAAILAKYGIK
jgi:hypothetical protein